MTPVEILRLRAKRFTPSQIQLVEDIKYWGNGCTLLCPWKQQRPAKQLEDVGFIKRVKQQYRRTRVWLTPVGKDALGLVGLRNWKGWNDEGCEYYPPDTAA